MPIPRAARAEGCAVLLVDAVHEARDLALSLGGSWDKCDNRSLKEECKVQLLHIRARTADDGCQGGWLQHIACAD